MPTVGLRSVVALFAVVALLAAAVPAAGAPDRPGAEPGIAPPLLHALTARLAALWPGLGASSFPESAREGPPFELDPEGEGPQSTSDEPTAGTELGPDADPDG